MPGLDCGRLERLGRRAEILRVVREFFARQGFLEVETPARVRAPGQEIHLDAFAAENDRYLITSPEYHMKRLVAAGLPRIYQICRCFRAGEWGPHHQPEFTMIEWYRADAPLTAIADDCEALLAAAATAVGRAAPPSALRTTVAAAVKQHAGVALAGDESAAELADRIRQAGHDPGPSDAWDDLFFRLFLDHVEPALAAHPAPVFLFDWPAPLAALARRHSDRPAWADRFELYAGGLELANAFAELTDPIEQRQRFQQESTRRAHLGKRVYPLDEALLAALPHMPATAGVALGFDRLVMAALGSDDIRDVIAFADDEV